MSRLIDADALKISIYDGWKPDMMVSEIWGVIDEAPTVGEWISVKDRLPKLEESVLVYGVGRTDGYRNKHTIEISYRYLYRSHWQLSEEEVWAEPWDYFFVNYKITHWMPLPEPPKEET